MIWVSLCTPQRGELSAERLTVTDRQQVIDDLDDCVPAYPSSRCSMEPWRRTRAPPRLRRNARLRERPSVCLPIFGARSRRVSSAAIPTARTADALPRPASRPSPGTGCLAASASDRCSAHRFQWATRYPSGEHRTEEGRGEPSSRNLTSRTTSNSLVAYRLLSLHTGATRLCCGIRCRSIRWNCAPDAARRDLHLGQHRGLVVPVSAGDAPPHELLGSLRRQHDELVRIHAVRGPYHDDLRCGRRVAASRAGFQVSPQALQRQ